MPVRFSIEQQGNINSVHIKNGAEDIVLINERWNKDTCIVQFPNFDSELKLTPINQNELVGYWTNFNKTNIYKIPFFATLNQKKLNNSNNQKNIAGRWETYFSEKPNVNDAGIMILQQKNDTIIGTVLTETGDYRFLEGRVNGTDFYLSAFDGTHAFLLNGSFINDAISGYFYSGKHYVTPFFGTKNDMFVLRNADSITKQIDEKPVTFLLKDIENNTYHFPNETTKNKVVIIQLMGTWCPNCMDETVFLEQLYADYHQAGLEIISIGYEVGADFTAQAAKIKRLQERYHITHPLLVGGKADKKIASAQFNMVNEISAFPTALYIGKDGRIRRIHTGFSGPGTGQLYTDFEKETRLLIERLLAE
jgi:thiol-disulfide isomerase/thioredoxin